MHARNTFLLFSVILAAGFALSGMSALAQERFIIMQSTTSTQASGLYDHLLPIFKKESGIDVRVVAVGTGQAIKNAQNCDGDVLLVHAKPAEEEFVAQGYGVSRHDLMYNDFIVVGPKADPAGVQGMPKVGDALAAIRKIGEPFASRGDESGTHKKEMLLWNAADIDPVADSGTWYRETGSGMGATLNAAIGMNAYTLTDRATWIAFKNKADHEILVEGDPTLYNQYGVIAVSPDACKNVRRADAGRFVTWLLSKPGQTAIGSYKLVGKQLFFPNAGMETN